jgi:methylphosphotriester-DNA--protein-cysteine methyltransferase
MFTCYITENETVKETGTLRKFIKGSQVQFAGYRPGKIYGTLSCCSGKRMKPENRVFFGSEQEAIDAGYGPCGHCLKTRYRVWKS